MRPTPSSREDADARPLLASEPGGVPLFLLLSCLITWSLWMPVVASRRGWIGVDLPPALFALGALGPTLAAVVAARRHAGRDGLRRLGRSLGRWRAGVRAVAFALIAPVGLVLGAATATRLLFGIPIRVEMGPVPLVVGTFAGLLLVTLGEEIGWRGLAQARLQESVGPLRAALAVGLVWAAWHLPAFWLTDVFDTPRALAGALLVYVPLVLAASVTHAWVFNASGGSPLWSAAHHAALGTASTLSNGASAGGGRFFLVLAVLWMLVAALLVWRGGHGLGTGDPPDRSRS